MYGVSRRAFLKTAAASRNAPHSVRDILPEDYEGTLRQLAGFGYRERPDAGPVQSSCRSGEPPSARDR